MDTCDCCEFEEMICGCVGPRDCVGEQVFVSESVFLLMAQEFLFLLIPSGLGFFRLREKSISGEPTCNLHILIK